MYRLHTKPHLHTITVSKITDSFCLTDHMFIFLCFDVEGFSNLFELQSYCDLFRE